jgi:hypothetical protein
LVVGCISLNIHCGCGRYEILITELVHARDVTRQLIDKNVKSKDDFEWLYRMRHYWNPAGASAPHGGGASVLEVRANHIS